MMASRAVLCLLLGLSAAALCVYAAPAAEPAEAQVSSAIELARYAYIITDVDEAASEGLPPHWKKHVDGVCTFDGKKASRCPRVGEDSWEFIHAGEDDQVMDYLRKKGIVKAGEHADYTDYKFKKRDSTKYADKVYDDEDSYGKQSGTGNRYYGAKNSHYKHDRSSKKHYDDDGDSYDRSSHKEVKYGHKHYYADGKDRDSYYDPGYGHTYDKPRHQHKGLRYTSVRHA